MRAIRAAIADYHRYTCLKFVPATSSDMAYFSFYLGRGCNSYVGYRGVVNRISLDTGCWGKGTVLHEMGHSLGLHHEQGRPDRDKYVEILWNNIKPEYHYAFQKKQGIEVLTPYDYDSIMHYPSWAFTTNGKLAIRTKDPSKQHTIGEGDDFSEIDKKQINLMYKCGGSTGGGSTGGGSTGGGSGQKPSSWNCWNACHQKTGNCAACGTGGACC